MSGKIAKSQVPVWSHERLPPQAKVALMAAKNTIRCGGRIEPFGNEYGRERGDGPPLPKPAQGCSYYEFQVGQARPGDPWARGAASGSSWRSTTRPARSGRSTTPTTTTPEGASSASGRDDLLPQFGRFAKRVIGLRTILPHEGGT
jgi:hypothetical protein